VNWSDDVLGYQWVIVPDVRPGQQLVVAEWVQEGGPMRGVHRSTVALCFAPEVAEHITRLHNESRQEASDATARPADLP
jgi:hypothetical protein